MIKPFFLKIYGKQSNDTDLSVGDFCPFHIEAHTSGATTPFNSRGIHAVCSSTVVKT